MKTRKSGPIIGVLFVALAFVGIFVIFSTGQVAPGQVAPEPETTRMADPQSTGTAVSQATANATQPVPSTTSVTTSPTVPPQGTPEPTILVIVHPSTVATGTHTSEWLGPTPNPTQQAEANLRAYLNERLYRGPSTLVAQGTNATPIPSQAFTGLSLTTYEIQRVDLPHPATWETWVPRASGGLELKPITFDRAWRVTVRGKGFIVANSQWMMYAGNTLLGPAIETVTGLTTIVYDHSLLREGSHLGISFAGGRQDILEALHWPGGQ